MIDILGPKRVLIILVLLVACGVLGAAQYLFMIPENERLQQEINGVRASIASTRAEAERMREEYKQVQEQKAFYGDLDASGFFNDQNRVVARERVEAIQRMTRALAVRYDIKGAILEANQFAAEAGHVVIDSPVSLDVDALDDVDIFSIIYWMENAFPGHVSLNFLQIDRVLDVSAPVLRQIGNGVPTVLVKGKLSFDWRTLRPQTKVEENVQLPQ